MFKLNLLAYVRVYVFNFCQQKIKQIYFNDLTQCLKLTCWISVFSDERLGHRRWRWFYFCRYYGPCREEFEFQYLSDWINCIVHLRCWLQVHTSFLVVCRKWRWFKNPLLFLYQYTFITHRPRVHIFSQ